MLPSHRLLALLLASLGAACGGSTTSDEGSTAAGGSGGSGGGAAGSGGGQSGQGGQAGKATCDGPCVPTEWCQKDTTTTCQCKSDAYLCPVSIPTSDPSVTYLVCYPKGEAACLPTTSPDLAATLGDKFPYVKNACSSFVETGGPKLASDGTMHCCYTFMAGPCVGRPLAVAEGLRLAATVRSASWG